MEMVRAKKSAGAAFTLACDTSGLDDKEIYIPLGIDAGTFSRIKSGKNSLAPDLLKRFCDVVGNTVYPEWLVYQIGYGLVMLKSEAERRAELAEKRAEEAESRVRWLTDLLQGKAVK